MTIQELENIPMSPALAYVLGLIFPFYMDKDEVTDVYHQKKYAAGCVNHNANMVSDADLAIHFKAVSTLCKSLNIQVKTNSKDKYDKTDFSCSSKKGFSCLIDTTGMDKTHCEEIFRKRIQEIQKCEKEIKKYFVRACFDGRGSWDTTTHFFSVDIDRKASDSKNRTDQFLLETICDAVIGNGAIQINQREWEHKKNDQLRLRPKFLNKFLNSVDLFSVARKKILLNGLKEIV